MLKFVRFPSYLSLITVAVHIFVYNCVYLHHYTRAGRYVAYMPYTKICSTCDVVNGCTANMKYKCHINILSHQPVIGSGVSLLSLSSNALSQHTAHSPAHPENSPGTCVFCISSRGKRGQREPGDSAKCCCCSFCVYLLLVKFSSLLHCFVSDIHFTAAVQGNFSSVRLIKDDLILSCKRRGLTLLRF